MLNNYRRIGLTTLLQLYPTEGPSFLHLITLSNATILHLYPENIISKRYVL